MYIIAEINAVINVNSSGIKLICVANDVIGPPVWNRPQIKSTVIAIIFKTVVILPPQLAAKIMFLLATI